MPQKCCKRFKMVSCTDAVMRTNGGQVIENPTCPVEWQQATPFLGYQDFMATGQPDLALAFTEQVTYSIQIP